MKWLNYEEMKVLLFGLVAAMVLSSGSVKADFTFSQPTSLGHTVNSSRQDAGARLSTNGLNLYFDSNRSGGYGQNDIWVTTRESENEDWLRPVNLGPNVNTSYNEMDVCISADALSLYFASNRIGGSGDYDIWVSTRALTSDPWSEPVNLGPSVCTPSKELAPSISGDNLSLYFQSDRSDGFGERDLWVTKRATASDPWEKAINLGSTINTSSADKCPGITPDGLTLIFSSSRPGGYSSPYDLWVTTRRTTFDPWREPLNLGPVINTNDVDYGYISPDCTMLYLSCWGRPGGLGWYDIWQASIIPIVDFNSDGFIDNDDLLIMIDNWWTDESLCDIGPMPFGDGVVDIEDLIVFMEYWEKENMPQESQDVE